MVCPRCKPIQVRVKFEAVGKLGRLDLLQASLQRRVKEERGVVLLDVAQQGYYVPNELATCEKTLLDLPPISFTVPITITRITASMTAYSATSCPSSFDQAFFKSSFTCILQFLNSRHSGDARTSYVTRFLSPIARRCQLVARW
jgi:hypothetical protein